VTLNNFTIKEMGYDERGVGHSSGKEKCVQTFGGETLRGHWEYIGVDGSII
jgi:hypothetical protein